jgi:hypothetical protein
VTQIAAFEIENTRYLNDDGTLEQALPSAVPDETVLAECGRASPERRIRRPAPDAQLLSQGESQTSIGPIAPTDGSARSNTNCAGVIDVRNAVEIP